MEGRCITVWFGTNRLVGFNRCCQGFECVMEKHGRLVKTKKSVASDKV